MRSEADCAAARAGGDRFGHSPSVTIANGSASGASRRPEPATRGTPCPPEAQATHTAFPYQLKIEVDKAPRPKDPKQLAVIDQTGCTGCEACIAFCPVDCIEIVPGPVHPDFMKLVEVDLQRCIGCQLCARYCPWETIDMWGYEEGLALAPSKTVRSILYDYDPETMHEAAETRAQG